METPQITEETLKKLRHEVNNYKKFFVPKGRFSYNQIEELKKEFVIKEIYITDEMINNGIDNIDEALSENERWNYAFSKKKASVEDFTEEFEELEELEDSEVIFDATPQDILRNYHDIEFRIKTLIDDSCGLDFITDKYLELLELEKEEARKVLISRKTEEFIKLL